MSIAHPPIPFRRAGQKYAFVVVGVIFLALLVSAGLRASPSVLLVPLEQSFGWNRSSRDWNRTFRGTGLSWNQRLRRNAHALATSR